MPAAVSSAVKLRIPNGRGRGARVTVWTTLTAHGGSRFVMPYVTVGRENTG